MKKRLHTLGPWLPQGDIVVAQRKSPVAPNSVNLESVLSLIRPVDERRANVLLIAAAPDAVDLLIRLQAELQNVLDGNVQPGAIAFEIRQINRWLKKITYGLE